MTYEQAALTARVFGAKVAPNDSPGVTAWINAIERLNCLQSLHSLVPCSASEEQMHAARLDCLIAEANRLI
jgi:hypothetical protein